MGNGVKNNFYRLLAFVVSSSIVVSSKNLCYIKTKKCLEIPMRLPDEEQNHKGKQHDQPRQQQVLLFIIKVLIVTGHKKVCFFSCYGKQQTRNPFLLKRIEKLRDNM